MCQQNQMISIKMNLVCYFLLFIDFQMIGTEIVILRDLSENLEYEFDPQIALGHGHFGDVVEGRKREMGTIYTNQSIEVVAVKLVHLKHNNNETKQNKSLVLLRREASYYKRVGNNLGFPKYYYDGVDVNEKYYALAIELLGPSVYNLQKIIAHDKLSISSVCLLGIQMLYALEHMHNRGLTHGDLKTRNFAVDVSNYNIIKLLDLGLGSYFINRTGHLLNEGESLETGRGTYAFKSIYAHNHTQISRRDDIESLGYVLISLMHKLPWQKYRKGDKEKILDLKKNTPIEDLVGQENIDTFGTIIFYARLLSFKQKPDYEFLRDLLRKRYLLQFYGNNSQPKAVEHHAFEWTTDSTPTFYQILEKHGRPKFYSAVFKHRNLLKDFRKIHKVTLFKLEKKAKLEMYRHFEEMYENEMAIEELFL